MRISKRILPFLLCALLGSCCKPDGNDPNSRPDASDNGKSLPDPVTISVIGTSDVHGHIEWAPILGGYVDILRAKRKSDGGVLLIDAGDMFQGTIAANETEGAAMIRAYNALGYDAASIGNHEFDYGPVGPNNIPRDPGDNPFGALQAAAKQAKFPLLAANLLDAATNKPVNWDGVAPSVIVDVRGISVGIVGVAGKNSLQSTIAPNVTTVKMEPPVDAILREAKQLREKGAAIVVVSAHEGGDCKKFDDPNDTSSCKVKDEIFNIANALDPGIVQVIVAAHTHQSMAHKVNGIAIIQSGADGNAFGRVDIKVDRTTKTVVDLQIHAPQALCKKKSGTTVTEANCDPGEYEGASVQRSPSVQAAVAKDLASAKAKESEQLGITLEKSISNYANPTSPSGEQFAAWMLKTRPTAQIAIINSGGIRATLPKGPLTYGSIYKAFPFDNRYATTRVKVAVIRKLLLEGYRFADKYSIAGVEVAAICDGTKPQIKITLGRRELRDDEEIAVVMSDYLAMTDRVKKAGMPQNVFVFEDDPPIREAVAQYLRTAGGSAPIVAKSPVTIPKTWPGSCASGSSRTTQR